MAEQLANSLYNPTTTLSASCTNVATTITVVSAAEMPATGNFRLRIDTEILVVTARSGTSLTVTRGGEGTVAAAHSNAAQVDLVLTAGALTQYVTEHGGNPNLGAATQVTISGDAISASALNYIRLEGEGGLDDDLDTITGGVDGQLIVLERPNTGEAITIRGGGNIDWAGNNTGTWKLNNNSSHRQVPAVYSDDAGKWIVHFSGADVVSAPNGINQLLADDNGVQVNVNGTGGVNGGQVFMVANGVGSGGRLGFFDKANTTDAVVQPSTPVTLGNIISALQDLGLVA